MKLKKLHLTMMAAATVFCNMASAQLFIDQATFTIQAGATVTVQGDVTSNTDIQGTGKVILKGSANQNVNMGGFSIPNLEIDNAANTTLTGNAKVAGDILFTNGKVSLGNYDLALGTSGTITGATSAKYVVTNGTGRLIKAGLGGPNVPANVFAFTIGNSLTSYTPIFVTNTGTADSIGARATAAVLSGGATGTAFTKEVVNNRWTITEAVPGGNALSITANWNSSDELVSFDRTRAGISNYRTAPADSVGWDLLNSQATGATGAGPYSFTRTGITSVGTFAIGTRPVLSPLLITPKVYLQGAYSTATGVMNDGLRTNNLIPPTEPYSTVNGGTLITTTFRGSGGGETAASSVIGSAAGVSTNNTIVDWVLVQLHRASDGVVVSQRAALLQRDGDVVDTDGSSPVNLAGNAGGNYFVSVRHRNHLGARTAASLALAKTTTANYDFTTSLSQAFPGVVVTNNAMVVVNSSPSAVYGLFSSNANTDLFTRKSGPSAINDYSLLLAGLTNTLGYYRTDYNLDGRVTRTGPNALLNDYSRLLTNFVGIVSAVITQPSF